MTAPGRGSFLNVDLVVGGADLAALGREAERDPTMLVLARDVPIDGVPCWVLELASDAPDLASTIDALAHWVEALPAEARNGWDRAERRVLDVGLEPGEGPAPGFGPDLAAAVARIRADVVLTVYPPP